MRKKHPRHDDDGNDGNTKFSNIRMIAGHEKCIMPFQPTSNGRINGCWVPPIVACVNYYKQDKKNKEMDKEMDKEMKDKEDKDKKTETECTIESVLERCGSSDIEASCVEVLDMHYNIHVSPWKDNDGREIWYDVVEKEDIDDEDEDEDGGMFEYDNDIAEKGATGIAFERVNEVWFSALKACIERDDIAILLCKRLEAAEVATDGKPTTHYLLVLGFEETIKKQVCVTEEKKVIGREGGRHSSRSRGRRGTGTRVLFVKDPMEGDMMLRAHLVCDIFNFGKIVLNTLTTTGGILDRFRPLECTHLRYYTTV
jgi:hypothetical protein